MKHKFLRGQIKSKAPPNSHKLQNCEVVIDGKSFFASTYENSGCKFILGGEYDRYANYLKNLLKTFLESDVTCYVVFNGGMKADLERRMEIHQKIINNTDAVAPGNDDNVYCEPIFVKDIYRQVLEELGIKYLVTEYDSREAIFSLAKRLNIPVVTDNFEFTLYGMSCITTKSLKFDKESKCISCALYTEEDCRNAFSMAKPMMPVFLTLVDEDSQHFPKLTQVIVCDKRNMLPSVLRWVRRQNKDGAINTIKKNLIESERTAFMKTYEETAKLCDAWSMTEMKYFQSTQTRDLCNNKDWFVRGVATGRIAVPYVNLKNYAIFSGSWLIVDKNKEDAMLSAIEIFTYAYAVLTNSPEAKITFIGRQFDKSCVWDVGCEFNMPISNEYLFMKKGKHFKGFEKDIFRDYVEETLPGFDFDVLKSVPDDCWVIIIAIVYYCKRNRDAKLLAYSILLSYIMLGPVSEKVGVIKRGNFLVSHNDLDSEDKVSALSGKDCAIAADKLMDLFYADNIKAVFDRCILHTLAEFQHCLQQMNYLNKLSGENIPCTVYYKAFNATFVYNCYLKMKRNNPLKYFEERLGNSPVFDYYKKIVNLFEDILKTVNDKIL